MKQKFILFSPWLLKSPVYVRVQALKFRFLELEVDGLGLGVG